MLYSVEQKASANLLIYFQIPTISFDYLAKTQKFLLPLPNKPNKNV